MNQPGRNVTIITAARPGAISAWRELRSYVGLYRYLFKQTALRRFQDTILGPAWLLLRPLLPSIAAIIIFTQVVPIPTNDVPYPVFYFAGYLFWGLFASIVAFVPRALRMNRGLMKKMYFPRLLIPLAALGIPLAELAVTIGVFLTLAIYYASQGVLVPVWRTELLALPLLFLLTILFALGVGMVAGVLSLVARDVLFTLPYFLQVWMLLTPVIYSLDFVPEQWRWLVYVLNPMATVVEIGRTSLLGLGQVDWYFLAFATGVILLVVVACTAFFLRAEDVFMDDI
jgi:lipopolysaccharide transport system permease protein